MEGMHVLDTSSRINFFSNFKLSNYQGMLKQEMIIFEIDKFRETIEASNKP